MITPEQDGLSNPRRPLPPEERGRTAHGLDGNERLPNGELRASAVAHPENFTRNTGEGAVVRDDRPDGAEIPTDADGAILPSDARGG
ncbi:hypothetical protein [Phenylobacterium sp.]|uniref:hypothetical protein n=1 Tax=Phenylobacterium sp. TaxID=1871053 RepID=UPI002734DC22|nr:hypothetical protein [Phenylobacterium sp.]MDP3660431.1 hypothetical protein [Phenylobacterium sp.]